MRISSSARACAIFYSQSTRLLWLSKIFYLFNISKIFDHDLALTKHGDTSKFTDMPVLSNFKISNIDLKFTLNLVAVASPRDYTF